MRAGSVDSAHLRHPPATDFIRLFSKPVQQLHRSCGKAMEEQRSSAVLFIHFKSNHSQACKDVSKEKLDQTEVAACDC